MPPVTRATLADAAEAELLAAAEWYEAQRPGLGVEFTAAVLEAAEIVATAPRAWPTWPGMSGQTPPVRRFVMDRFPYTLGFQIFDDRIEIVAVAHAHRRPGYWQRRSRPR